jgi:hypothetical protein
MKSITVERVLKAYEAGVIRPGFKGWGNIEKNCGCAISALAIYEKNDWYNCISDVLENIDHHGTVEICEAVGVTWPYMLGFTDAFDGMKCGTSRQGPPHWDGKDESEYFQGYEDGVKVRAAVIAKYFPEHAKV